MMQMDIFNENSRTNENEDLFKPTKPSKTFKLYLSAASALCGLFLCGMGLGFSSSALPNMKSTSGNTDEGLTSSQQAYVGSLLNIGAILGVPLAEFFSQKIGRRDTMALSTVLFIAGNILLTHAPDLSLILTGRVIVGGGVGALSIVCPLYLFEIVHKQFRQIFEAYAQTSMMGGVFMSYLLAYCSHWQWMAFTSGAFGLVCLIVVTLVAESPFWLVAKDKKSDALQVLSQLRGPGSDVRDECDEIEASIIYQQFKSVKSWQQLIQWRRTKPALVILGIVCFNQLSGAHVIIFYAQNVLRSTQSMFHPARGAVFLGVVFTLCAFLTGLSRMTIRWKSLLLTSQIGLTIFNLIFAIFFYLSKEDGEKYIETHPWVPVTGLLVFAISYTSNPILTDLSVSTDTVVSEIRRSSHCLLMVAFYVLSFVMTVTFHQSFVVATQPFGEFFAFFALSLIGVFYIWHVVPNIHTFDSDEIEVYSRTSVND